MRGLFTKIFLGFWIAQSLTFAISTMLILQRSFVRPNEIMDVLKTALPSEGAAVVNTYETAGCSGLREYAASRHLTIYLADTPNHFLCDPAGAPNAADALAAAGKQPGELSTPGGDFYLWSTTIHSATGRSYVFLLSRPRIGNKHWLHDLVHFAFPQLWVAIVAHPSDRQTAGGRSQSGKRRTGRAGS
jgi:hypothetical protein